MSERTVTRPHEATPAEDKGRRTSTGSAKATTIVADIDRAKSAANTRASKWRDENRAALSDANRFLGRHGLWSDGERPF